MHHGNTTNSGAVAFVLIDDDGGGPGHDLGSDDVVDPDDVSNLTEVSDKFSPPPPHCLLIAV
jgi:hypothetical protein